MKEGKRPFYRGGKNVLPLPFSFAGSSMSREQLDLVMGDSRITDDLRYSRTDALLVWDEIIER